MILTAIEIVNLAGFKNFKTALPCIALISGANGKGKSSLINVIKYAFGRRALSSGNSRGVEHDPRLLHGDAEKGEAVITFDDGSQLRVTVTKDSTERMVKPKDGARWLRSTRDIDEIANALSYDPLQFKAMDEKKRVETLLRIMPVTITKEELAAAVGDTAMPVDGTPSLAVVESLYSGIYAKRTEVNREADTLDKHAGELERALPAGGNGGRDWHAETARLSLQRQKLDEAEKAKIETIRKTLEAHKEERNQEFQRETAAIHSEVEAKINELIKERDARKAAARMSLETNIDAARAEANKQAAVIKAEFTPLREGILAELATAQERDRAGQQSEGTQKAAKQARDSAEKAKAEAKRLTEALVRLASLKETIASRLPIKGITIAAAKQGLPVDICRVEGGHLVPFSSWNDADKDTFCLRVAVLSRGACGLVCIDSIADFDPERRKSLRAAAEKYAASEKMQFIMGLATSGPLKVSGGPEAWEEE